MDITDREKVFSTLNDVDYDIMLHLAAYTNVDGAELNQSLAWRINVEGTKNVYEATINKKKHFLYISTDFVFDGEKTPFFENSVPHPLSFYGKTKWEAEKIIGENGMIVRISYPYRARFEAKNDIVRSIINSLKDEKPISAVTDQIVTLTFIDDIAYCLKHLLNNFSTGIFHIVGVDSLSAYDAVLKICDTFNFDKSKVLKTTYDEFYKDRALRPRNGIIKSNRNNFFSMKTLEQGLIEIKQQIS